MLLTSLLVGFACRRIVCRGGIPRFAAAALILLAARGGVAAQEAAAVPPPNLSRRLDDLEQRQKALESRLRLGEAQAGEYVDGKPVVKANPGGPDGFSLQSADGDFRLRFGGVIQVDERKFVDRESAGAIDQFLVRRARLYLEGVVRKCVEFRVLPDFGNGQPPLQEAYVDLNYTPIFRVQAGKFKEPLGLERLQSEADTLFIERGLPSDLAPNRDVGVQLHGELLDKTVAYALALVDGVPDGGIADGDADNGKDGVARVFVRPFLRAESPIWSDLGVGVAGSLGRQNGSAAASGLPSYSSEAQQSFFTYLPGVAANGFRRRLSPQAYWYPGNFGLLGEYVETAQMVARTEGGPTSENLTSRSWQVAGSWVLTGEKTSFNGLKPRRDLDPKKGAWGAWELAARYSALEVDSDAFPRYADPRVSSRRADAWTGGLNWYLDAGVRFDIDFMRTKFAGGSRGLEQALFSRLQIGF